MSHKNSKKEKKFIKKPSYPGGKEVYKEFIRKNLQYPDEARKNKVEGTVHVSYVVNGPGEVEDAWVTHGIGSGCDEEALRVVKLLKYDKAKNRGLRIKSTMRTRINFNLKDSKKGVKYSYKSTEDEKSENKNTDDKASGGQGTTYSYTIKW